ncbi:hypothetical protein EG68_03996 [Paragonimus skrjabini miyazakii]|uniref:Basement membrane-specific heparan sulfate proteoglycan core protein n=1 Tax=Paragonimus skrjabini miyazakii TaxID=59628 RepID=A0A8S9YFT2_9TREM|nr:hypothetical protein EG68_03996 [Paragonimus skrjabini miyazakii]
MLDFTGSSGYGLSQFSLSRSFMLSVLTLISLLCTTQCEQNLGNYTYSVRSGTSNKFIQLTCPLHYAQPGDEVVYYKLNVFDSKPDLLRIVPINSDTTVESVHYPIHQWSPDLHIYCEIQRNSDGAKIIVSRTDFNFNALSGPTKFVHEPSQTVNLEVTLGQPFVAVCPIKNPMNRPIAWYRLPGYRLDGFTESVLFIQRLTASDVGTYYCAIQEDEVNDRLSVAVQVIQLLAEGHSSVMRPAIISTNYLGSSRYECPRVPNALTPVVWEQPLGSIHLGHYQPSWLISHTAENGEREGPAWCHFDVFGDVGESNVNEQLIRARRQPSAGPLIKMYPRKSTESMLVTLSCHWTGPIEDGQTLRYRWKNSWDDQTEVADEITATLIDPQIVGLAPEEERLMTCEAEIAETGDFLGKTDISLIVTPMRMTGILDLKDTNQKVFSYESGEAAQITCDVDKQHAETGKDIVWTLNDGPLRTGMKRTDRLLTSIIIIPNMTPEDEGVFTCEQQGKIRQIHLIEKSVKLELELLPESDTRWANAGENTEFRCRLYGRNDGNRLVDWSFIPAGTEEEIHVQSDVEITRPSATPSTSFLTIDSVQKYHEGQYVCRAFDLKKIATLVVKTREISVTPESVDARPGTTVRFLCELSVVPGARGGKLYWIRTDRRDLTPGKEEVIGSTGGRTLLIVKSLDWSDNGTVYMCTDGVSSVTAQLFVRDVCGPGYRACSSHECIESNRFCDGKEDCADGSDELQAKCLECGANEFTCEIWNHKRPVRNCYLQYWRCDGEDDCGNNFDEAGCPPPSPADKCNGTHYTCPTSGKLIARAFMCDSVPDCEPDGEDEHECSLPTVIEPSGDTQLFGLQSGNLTLTCVVYGRPPPAINWRFNWGGLREGVDHVVNTTVVDCNKVISHLTLTNLEPHASGLYTCEAVNKGRTLAPDISVNVAKGGLCTPPMFNDAAWFEDMCHLCYCSGVTNRCESAKGYVKSSTDKSWDIVNHAWQVRAYTPDGVVEVYDGVESTEQLIRFTYGTEHPAYLESTFGLNGSLLTSYGYNLKFTLRQFGSSSNYLPGALVALHGKNKSAYWCPPSDRVLLYTLPVGYDNPISVRFNERDRWYSDLNCTQSLNHPLGRSQFMDVLRDVQRIGIRMKNYGEQVSVELQDMTLEYATESDVPGVWVAEVEQCECPVGYEGLSCERCANGYEEDPNKPGSCRLRCACDQCDDDGNCLKCPGKRSGPRCEHCEPGFYRPPRSALSEDCIPCEKCTQSIAHTVKECIGSTLSPDDYVCKCQPKADGKVLDPECDQCELAKQLGIDPPPEAKCDEKPEPSPCNPAGTNEVSDTGECQCKDGYEGERCDQCSAGFFAFENRCLGCYCAGQTSDCKLAEDHYFVNVTMDNPFGYSLDVWLAQRTIFGGLSQIQYTPTGQPRIERTPTEFIVRHPLVGNGIIHLAIQLEPPKSDDPAENDLPVYRNLYGGQMSFRLDSANLDANLLTQGEARVIVELESSRYGRVWTQAVFNTMTQRYEVEFDENWWPGGWKLGTPEVISGHGQFQGLTRAQLLRVLATTSAIGIVTSSGQSESLRGLRLRGLAIQVAQPLVKSRLLPGATQQPLPLAPVEICECPAPSQEGERRLSLSCEGCRDPKQRSIVRLEPFGEDLICGGCLGPDCEECPKGQFTYDVYTGERFDTCQTGLAIHTNRRRIVVEVGDPVVLVCRATSYRGGIATHDWIRPNASDQSPAVVTRRSLAPSTVGLSVQPQAFTQSMHHSEAVLRLNSARKEDTGAYTCRVTGVGSIVEQPFYLVVYDKGMVSPVPAPEDDTLNQKYPLSVPRSKGTPQFVTYQMEADPSDKGVTIVRATLSKPSDLADHRLIWLSANGSRIPIEMIRADEDTGEVEVRLATPYDPLEEQTDIITGYFIGKDPVSNPYWTPMAEPEFIESDKDLVTWTDIIKPPAEVSIRFMEPYKIPIGVSPGKSKVRVEWRRVGEVPGVAPTVIDGEDMIRELPEGMQQERNDLLIHAAAEQHEGIYEAVVYRGKDGEELGRFNVTIRVLPLNPGGTSHLEAGEAKDLPGDVDESFDVTETPPKWDFVVQGFTPEAEHCEYPRWTLVDYQRNTSTDVTDKVHRLSPSNFRVEYPLTSGIYLRFQCQPVPRSNLTGEIKFNITSDDPRIVFQSIYDNPDSTFPTRLICMDLNPGQHSDLKISSDTMDERRLADATFSVPAINRTTPYGLPARKLELDWRRVGEFDPFNDAGQFTCFVNNTMSSGSKTLTLPSGSVPVEIPEDPFTRVYIYSPDVFVSPESTVEVREGDQLRLYCQYDSRPLGDFHGWSSDSPVVQAQMQVTHRGYSSRIATQAASLDLHEQSVQCKFGDQQKPIRIKVISKEKPRLFAMVTSDALVGDRLIGTTGGDMELQCEVKQIGGRPSEIDRIDWFVQYANGIRRSVVKSRLAQEIELEDNGRRARFTGLSKSSTGAKVFCVVRPVDALTAIQAYHPSPAVDLWIRPAKIAAHIEPQHGPGVVVGDEAETIRLSCVVTDMWRNRTVRDAVISWENRVTPSNTRPEHGSELKPTSHDMPWLVTRPVDRELIVGGLRKKLDWVGEFRCLAEDLHSDATAYSDWVRLEVRAGDVASRIPRLRIIPQANPTFPFYPTSVQCVDENQNYPSEVTWIRQGESTPPEDVETQPNSATLHWKVGDVNQFDPRTHSGVYICRASNPYASTSQQYYFPQEMMPDEPIPLSEHRLQITSTVNEIFRAEEDPYARVIQGHPFELVCTYYGHPPPPGGLRWSIERVNRTDQSITSHWMAMQGLRITSGRQYWTQVGTAKFDETGRQTGLFQCAALNRDGGVYKLAQVRVELYKVNVKIAELADSGLIEGVEGENGVITCNAFDGYFDFILPEATYSWEFEKRNGDRVHQNLLATTVRVDGNRIEYEGLSTAANGFRARCVAMNNTARYVSADFGFRVRRVSGEPMKRPETEPSGTRWAKGDGSEGVLLVITGLKDATGHASLSEGDDANLTCIAVDSVTNKPFTQGEFHFGWQLAGIRGEPVSTNQLAIGSVQMQSSPSGDAGYFLVENARSSSNPPQPTARILCLATRQSEAVTYVSSPIDYVVYPKDIAPDYKKERDLRDNRSKILVEVTGLDSRGMLSATEGSVKTLKCAAVDRSKGLSPVTDAEYAWEFSRLDGMPVDTATMVVPGAGTVQLNGDEATFRGLRQTSTVKGRCVVRVPQAGDETQEARDAYYSPYFKFDIVDEDGMGYRDFASSVTPQIPSEKSDVAIVNVTGLDKLGYLTGSVGQDTILLCTTFNVSTNEPIDQEQYDVHYGWEFQQMDGLPAISSEIASDIQSNSVNGQLQLTHLKEQSPESPTRGRCVVELLPKDVKKPRMQPALDGKRIASPYFFINVPPKSVVVPEFVDVVRERYELTVQGLNEHGVLPLKQNTQIQLDCIVRDAETDTLIDGLTAKQTVGWKLPIYPSGQIGNLGDLAQKVQSQGSKIYLDDVRGDAVDGLRGACWFYDGLAYYYSPYFPIIVPRSTTDGRVRVEVQEIGTDDDRRYSCAAYHTQTGTRLLNVSYQWVFTTKTGEPILPGYYFESMQSHENELTFQSRRVDKQLPEHLRDKGPIEGRCLVLYQPFAGDLNKPSRINVYSSNPFVLIQPQAEDPSKMLLRPDPLKKDRRVLALVDGVDRGLVTVPEDGTVTLTCQATDSETMKPLEDLSYRWEIQQRDGSSVSTSGVVQEAVLVEGTGGNRLTLVGVRLKAAGLRGRCIITNQTTTPEEVGMNELGLLKPGEEVASAFFDFNVLRTSAPEDEDGTLEYAGLADFVIDGDPRQFAVVIGGLDETGRLKAQEGEDVTLEIKLKDMATGELKSVHSDPTITHIGLETRYDNGQSAPFSALAETVKVHGKDGVINLNNVRPGSRPPTQFRVVVEREELISRPNGETGVIVEKKRVRYASDYVDVVALKEGEVEAPGMMTLVLTISYSTCCILSKRSHRIQI